MNEQPAESPMRLDVSPCQLSDDMPLAIESGADGESLCTHIEKDIDLARIVCKHYCEDSVFVKVLSHLEAYPHFGIKDSFIWTKN